jgi:nucleotide-binding universal stress UspA family protein
LDQTLNHIEGEPWMFTKIVVPLDGSAQANAALPLARTLARATGAAVTLVRVKTDTESREEVTTALSRVAEELAGAAIHVQSVVRDGDPADEILDEVKKQHADLVVMRTHGRSGLGRAVLGSVTERIVKASDVPVVLLRPGGQRVSQVRTLLVPVDGSPGGAVALGTAIGLSKSTGAALRLVEVVVPIPTYIYSTFAMNGAVYVDPAWDAEAQAGARTYVDALIGRLRAAGVDATGEVAVESSVADTIVKTADEHNADLIVMSSQALTGVARAFLGSVADAVVRASHCPVLLIHRPPEVDDTGSSVRSDEALTSA